MLLMFSKFCSESDTHSLDGTNVAAQQYLHLSNTMVIAAVQCCCQLIIHYLTAAQQHLRPLLVLFERYLDISSIVARPCIDVEQPLQVCIVKHRVQERH